MTMDNKRTVETQCFASNHDHGIEENNKQYRSETTRLKNWDYGQSGWYFITICTKNREHFFGKIINGKMELSEIGEIVKQEWIKTPNIRSDMNLELDEFIIMPNHFHAIIIIGDNKYNKNVETQCIASNSNEQNLSVSLKSTPSMASLRTNNKFGPQSKNLASIIRGFKSAVTINARKTNPIFAWQPRFHDHIIRNDESLKRIREYTINNPLKWHLDKYYEN